MRREPKPVESASVAALVEAFLKDGHETALVSRDIEDKPDALLDVAGVRVACECIQIPPQYIYHHHHKRFPESAWCGKRILSLVWPNEPHQWVAEAIRKKVALHRSYLEATGATDSWLLVHAPIEANQFFVDGNKEWVQWAMRHGAKMIEHPFSQIFLWTPQAGVHPIWVRSNETGTHSSLGIDFAPGYPTLCVNRFAVPFTTLTDGKSGYRKFRVTANDSEQIIISPQDAEYARHRPAHRTVAYETQVIVWANRAEVTTTVSFRDEPSPIRLAPCRIDGLSPGTQYWHHASHEFRAPKLLHTYHAVQPF